MRAVLLCLLSSLLVGAPQLASAAPAAKPANGDFEHTWGGYITSSAFQLDTDRPGVILPPASLRAGDLLSIRPLRLSSDEYLILQQCVTADCAKAQVVRAWNAYGYMGPYPVLTNFVAVQPGGKYLLWLQRVPTQGNSTFHLYERDAPPLVFQPLGSPNLFAAANLQAAREHGPTQIKTARTRNASFLATFAGGSVVQLQALRAAQPSALSIAP